MKRKMNGLDDSLTLDASVVVKWFKKGEKFEREALNLRDEILKSKVHAITSEWLLLEVVRGLVKAGYPKDKIEQAYSVLKEMTSLGFIEAMPVGEALEKAKAIEIDLSLYASDSIYLATSIISQASLISEDKHLLDKNVTSYAQKQGIKIMSLRDRKP